MDTATHVEYINYRGWERSIRLHNTQAEAVVVPLIGRIMSFRLTDGANVFWEDTTLSGQRGDTAGHEWLNFGGEKTWPAPESDWARLSGDTAWMPPAAFDRLPHRARIADGGVGLESAIDPDYGIRVHRRITLSGSELRVQTVYERATGEGPPVSVWAIAQFREPLAVALHVPSRSRFPDGHFRFDEAPWPQLQLRGDLLWALRDPAAPHKLGSDAHGLLWIGERESCLVTASGGAGDYPDRGARTELFTSADPKAYVELETLGPLVTLSTGERAEQMQVYALRPRRHRALEDEARELLGITGSDDQAGMAQ